MLYHIGYKYLCAKKICHARQRPCQCQNHDWCNHGFKSIWNTLCKLTERKYITQHIINKSKCERHASTKYQTYRCARICECIHKGCSRKKATGINHGYNTACNQYNYWKHQIKYMRVFLNDFFFIVLIRSSRCCKQITGNSIHLMMLHRSKIHTQNSNCKQHY